MVAVLQGGAFRHQTYRNFPFLSQRVWCLHLADKDVS
jgi:hypothetical protein